MSRYIHEDGTDTSLAYASEIMQNLANNDIRNATKIITLSPGFLPNSFVPVAIEKDPTNPSVFILRITAGPAIFPDGEVFCGGNFVCSIKIEKNQAPQYLKLVHQELKRNKTRMSYGHQEFYSEILDGARLVLTTSEDSQDNELKIAKITYPIVAKKPEVEIIKDEWKYYWSGQSIVDPNETINASSLSSSFTLSMTSAGALVNNPNQMYNQSSFMSKIRLMPSAEENSWDLIAESSGSNGRKFAFKDVYPHNTQPGTIGEILPFVSPPGVDFSIRLRKSDAYRSGISTGWTELELLHDDTDDDINISTMVHEHLPIIAIRISGSEDVPEGSFAQVWIAEGVEPDVQNSVPSMEIPIQRIPSSSPLDVSYPFSLYLCHSTSSNLQIKYRMVNPELHVSAMQDVNAETYSAGVGGTRDIVMDLPVGSDRLVAADTDMSTIDGNGVRIYFNNSTIRFYLPRRAPAPGVTGNQFRYLKNIEFVNFKPAEMGSSIVTGATATISGAFLRISESSSTWARDLSVGSYVQMMVTSGTPDELPQGRMLIEAIDPANKWIDVSPLYYPAAICYPYTGVIDVYADNEPLADLRLYDVTTEEETLVGNNLLIAGASPENALAGFAGSVPIFNANFPVTPYTDTYTSADGLELEEGHWYEFRFHKASGEASYFDMVGRITLTLSEA